MSSAKGRPQLAKDLYKSATNAFLHRQHASALGSLSQLFALLPPAPPQSWAVELPPKTRAAERWRTKAFELMITAEVMLYKSTREGEEHDEEKVGEHFAFLERRAIDLFAPSTVPPSVVLTLSRACLSLGLSPAVARQSVETWLSGVAPVVLPALAIASDQNSGSKSVKEGVESYTLLAESYWVELMGSESEAAREEARRLVAWDEVVPESHKHRILSRLVEQPSASDFITQSAFSPSLVPSSPEATDLDESFASLPPPAAEQIAGPSVDDETQQRRAKTLTNRSAYTGSVPSSPTLSSRGLSPAPPRPATILDKFKTYLSPTAIPSLALLLFVVFVIRMARARRVSWRTLLVQWVLTAMREIGFELADVWRLGTTISYV